MKTAWAVIVCVMIIIVVIWFGVFAIETGKKYAYQTRIDKCMQTERFTEKDCEYIAGVLWDSMLR